MLTRKMFFAHSLLINILFIWGSLSLQVDAQSIPPAFLQGVQAPADFSTLTPEQKLEVETYIKSQTPGETVILADIGLYGAKILSKDDTTVTIGFDIANNAEVSQSDIKYGIDIIKASPNGQTIVDTLVSNETLTLATHETQSKTLTYTIPPFLSGEYEIWLISRTTGGLMLGLSMAGKTNFTSTASYIQIIPESCSLKVASEENLYTLYQGVDISKDENIFFSCTLENHSDSKVIVTPYFDTFRRSMYGEKSDIVYPVPEEVSLNPNEKKPVLLSIPKATIPQAYDVSIVFKDKTTQRILSNKIVAHYVLRGGSATIQQITLDRDTYNEGDTLNARFFWSPSADGFFGSRAGSGTEIGTTTLRMTVTNTDGTACVEPITQSLSPTQMEYTITAPVIAPCTSPQASFTLTDAEGNTLDTRNIESPTQPEVVTQNTPETPTEVPFWNIRTIAMLLVVISSLAILFVVIRMLRLTRSTSENNASSTILKTLIAIVIAGASVFGGVGEVGAVSFNTGAFSGNINLNKTTYSPGEVITVDGSIYSNQCGNGGPLGNIVLDSELLGSEKYLIYRTVAAGPSTIYGTAIYTAPIIPGSYNLHWWICFYDITYSFSIANPAYYFGFCYPKDINFTVTAPPPVNCVGSWNDNGMCSVSGACGQTGTVQQTFTQTTPASGGGASCTSLYGGEHGATRVGSTACSTALCVPPVPTVDLRINSSNGPVNLIKGANRNISWNSTNATSCTASSFDIFSGGKTTSSVVPEILAANVTSDHTLTCTGLGGSASDSVQVNVTCTPATGTYGSCDCSTETKTRTNTLISCLTSLETTSCDASEKNACRNFNWEEIAP